VAVQATISMSGMAHYEQTDVTIWTFNTEGTLNPRGKLTRQKQNTHPAWLVSF